MTRRPATLFQRTGLTLAAALLVFMVFTLLVTRWLVFQPVTERAAEELAALLELSAKVWVELPPWTRADYGRELERHHGLRVGGPDLVLRHTPTRRAYLDFLEAALSRRFGTDLHVHDDPDQPDWYWVSLPVGGRDVRVGFRRNRLQDQVPAAMVLVVIGGAVLVLLTSLLLVRRVTLPLSRLSAAVRSLGRGEPFRPLPQSGPAELADLADRINRTERQIRELLENRTTMLAGISHDLRTPIARMQLELELLPPEVDDDLLNGLRQNLDEMNLLIGRTLELARDLDRRDPADSDPASLMRAVSNEYARAGTPIEVEAPADCPVRVPGKVLRRVLGNLLDNALRYGGHGPVALHLTCTPGLATLLVVDHGPGIPAEERAAVLRPFHRVEASRASHTGGSGLGLAIVAQLCETHGWLLTLDDTAGGGLTVRLDIRST